MRRVHRFYQFFLALVLTLVGGFAVAGPPGCEGKMWNPIVDIDFRLMGGIKIAGIPLMKAPKHLGEPPNHKVNSVCFCKDGWKTGVGLGLTYWLPSYLSDVARQAGCIGFLDAVNILPGFVSLSSGQEYNLHSQQTEGVTVMQVHWAYADITAIAGKNLFETCDAVSSALSIAYMTEIDVVYQNDVYAAIMTPQISILSSNALLSQMSCGLEATANTLGAWQDIGFCGWKGTRLPLTVNSISKDMAQVSNMDVMLKYLTRSALTGTLLRTMGKDVACKPKWSPFYDPFQHRYQWAYPAKVSTRYNVDVVRWGLFIKPEGMLQGMRGLGLDTALLRDAKPESTSSSPDIRAIARRVLDNIPKPLNYPTKEAGYMHVWEARTCCMMVLTIETIVEKVIENIATQGGELVKQLYDLYQTADTVYSFVQNPIGGALNIIGDGLASVFDGVGETMSDWASNIFSAASTTSGKAPVLRAPDVTVVPTQVLKGASSGIAHSMMN